MEKSRRNSLEMTELRARVRLLAQAQGGVFRRSDLRLWGIDPSVTQTLRSYGWWVRLHHGVYIDEGTLADATTLQARHLIHATASVAATSGPAALFGPASALLWGLPVDRRALRSVHLVRPRGHDSRALRRRVSAAERLPGASIHVINLGPDDTTVRDGVVTVSRELAGWSTALVSDPDWGVATLDAVAWQAPQALKLMEEFGRRWPRLHGSGLARRALNLARTGAQSPLESLSRLRLVRAGLPEPRLQVPIHDQQGLIGYVDMLFEELGVVGEADGQVKYATREDLVQEKRREDRLRSEGYGVVRWDWAQAQTDMARVARRIQQSSEHSRRRRRPAS